MMRENPAMFSEVRHIDKIHNPYLHTRGLASTTRVSDTKFSPGR